MHVMDKRHDPSVGKRFPFRMADVVPNRYGYLVNTHWHDHLEFIKIVKGRALITLDNQSFTAVEGDIIYINSRQVHTLQSLSGTESRIKGMIFDRLFITNLLEGFETRHLYSLFIGSGHRHNLFSSNHPLWPELNACIEISDREFADKDICYEMAIKSSIYRMVTAMLRHFKQEVLPLSNNYAPIRPVLDYIETHFSERLALGELAALVNMSPSHFCRTFKEMIGVTLTQYITNVRINNAKQLIVNQEWTIGEIAEKTGFCNIHYFGRVFKKTTGVSPLQFKNDTLMQSEADRL